LSKSAGGSWSSGAVNKSWILSNSSSAAVTGVPFTRSVINDDEATEIAHPVPLKRMSSILPPSSFTYSVILSPQSGLTPATTRVASASSPKLRGLRL
jgi:hypothetical protein